MGRIVSVTVVDLTRPVEQKGFKTHALLDFTTDLATAVISDVKTLTPSTQMYEQASKYFGNGGGTLVVAGKAVTSSGDIGLFMADVHSTNEFYGVTVILPKAEQATYVTEVQKFIEGNKLLGVIEVNGTKDEVVAVLDGTNSDRLVAFANSIDVQNGTASGVAGVCMPQDEGSITWGNKVVTGIPASGYSASDEQALLAKNINYITKEKGLIITQFGRTTSGSNADITRSKDWLENRCAEALTSTLVNNKKVPFTTPGMAMISSSLNQVGVQAVEMGMLDSFVVLTPAISSIPTNDKANRVLRGVKFIATLSGAVETIEMELQVKL
ncbi:MAG: DUF3383 family protein [Paraclostridium sp.]